MEFPFQRANNREVVREYVLGEASKAKTVKVRGTTFFAGRLKKTSRQRELRPRIPNCLNNSLAEKGISYGTLHDLEQRGNCKAGDVKPNPLTEN